MGEDSSANTAEDEQIAQNQQRDENNGTVSDNQTPLGEPPALKLRVAPNLSHGQVAADDARNRAQNSGVSKKQDEKMSESVASVLLFSGVTGIDTGEFICFSALNLIVLKMARKVVRD